MAADQRGGPPPAADQRGEPPPAVDQRGGPPPAADQRGGPPPAVDQRSEPPPAARPLTVLQVRSSRGLHGPERTLLELAPALAARGVATPLLVLYRPHAGDPPEHPLVSAARAAGLAATSVRDPGPLHMAVWRHVAERLALGDPDAVHTHDYKADLLVAAARWRWRGPSWVATVHLRTGTTPQLRLYARLAEFALRRADRVVAVSSAQAEALAARGIDRARLATVRTVVDADARARDALADGGAAGARAAAGVPPDAPLVVLVGRLTRQKGVDVALHALARLRQAVPDATLVVVGDGPDAEPLRALARALGVTGAVRWAGHLANPLPLMAAADVVVLPSRAEGLPRVALEAAALGRPVVASSVGGLPEAIIDGETGLIVSPGDADGLASAVALLLGDAVLARRLGAAAAADVRARFALSAAADALAAVYWDVCSHPAGVAS